MDRNNKKQNPNKMPFRLQFAGAASKKIELPERQNPLKALLILTFRQSPNPIIHNYTHNLQFVKG